jgi:hypothetical protein
VSRRAAAAAWVLLAVVLVVLVFVVGQVSVDLPGDAVLVLAFHDTYTHFGWRSAAFAVAVVAPAGRSAWASRRAGDAR